MRGKLEGVPVSVFRLDESTGLLMNPALVEPGLDRELMSRLSGRVLTASICSIHDAFNRVDRE